MSPTIGAGAFTCRQYAEHYRENPDSTEKAYYQWAQGFMSGFNFGEPSKKWRDLAATSTDDQRQFLFNYCADNPLRFYMEGVLELYLSLPIENSN